MRLTGDQARAKGLIGLDGLRAIAATAVLVDHTAQHSQPAGPTPLVAILMLGAQGLTLFFVLSGFLLYRPFVAALLGTSPMPSVRRYLRGRAGRIYPAYLTVYLLAAFALGVVSIHTPQWHAMTVGRPTDPHQVLADLLLVQTLFPSQMGTGIVPAWSLTTELTFYASLPLLTGGCLLLGRRLRPALRAAMPPLILVVMGVAASVVLVRTSAGLHGAAEFAFDWGATPSAVLSRSLLAQSALFGFGMAVALATELSGRRGLSLRPVQRALLTTAATVLILRGTLAGGRFGILIVGLGFSLLLVAVIVDRAGGGPAAIARGLDLPPLRALGTISYSVYLWHMPVISWLVLHGVTVSGDPGLPIDIALVFCVTVPLAWVTYVLVERPAMRWARRPRRRDGAELLLVGTAPQQSRTGRVSVQLPEPDLAPAAFHGEHSDGSTPGAASIQRRSP